MASLSNFGIPGAGAGILAPKLRFRYRVTFQNMGRLIAGANSRDLTMQVTTISLPNITWEEVTMHRYNSTDYVAGKHSWEPLSMTFEDDITGLATAVIEAQMETQQRLVGGSLDGRWLNAAATGSDYKFGLVIDQLDGNEGVVASWLIEGAWLASVDFADLDSSASEAATITCSIRYSHARKVNSGQGYGTAIGGVITS